MRICHYRCGLVQFQSTLSVRRATLFFFSLSFSLFEFQSTLSVRRATTASGVANANGDNFNPRSPCGERHQLYTLLQDGGNFNPRSPCGERHVRIPRLRMGVTISIHALRAESDLSLYARPAAPVGYFNPRSPCGGRLQGRFGILQLAVFIDISIHALRAESDGR